MIIIFHDRLSGLDSRTR